MPNEIINSFFANIDYSKPLAKHAESITKGNLENFFLKAILLMIIFSVAKGVLFYSFQKGKSNLKNDKKPKFLNEFNYFEFKNYEKWCEKQGILEKTEYVDNYVNKDKNDSNKVVNIQEIPIQDPIISDLSQQARSLFNVMLKNKQLKREEILAIKQFLRENVNVKSKKYNSDAHEIYSKLKSPNLKEETVLGVIKFLQERAV